MSEESFDVVFIGGGPGGYVGAIKAAQLGLDVACVEMRGTLGGTCLNVGCIPSKALLQSSHHYVEADKELAAHGVQVAELKLDLKTMMGRKDSVVGDLTKGIEHLFKKNKIEYVVGAGRIAAPDKVVVALNDGKERELTAENIVIATGSEVMPLPGIEIDEKTIVSSTGALALSKVPKHLVVVGGGYIGLELGSVWRRLGAEVTVVEFLDRLAPGMDGELAKHLQRALKKQGMNFKLSTKVTGAKKARGGVELSLEPAAGGDVESLKANVVLVSIGRRPYTEGLGLEEAGVTVGGRSGLSGGNRCCLLDGRRRTRRSPGRHARPRGAGGGNWHGTQSGPYLRPGRWAGADSLYRTQRNGRGEGDQCRSVSDTG